MNASLGVRPAILQFEQEGVAQILSLGARPAILQYEQSGSRKSFPSVPGLQLCNSRRTGRTNPFPRFQACNSAIRAEPVAQTFVESSE